MRIMRWTEESRDGRKEWLAMFGHSCFLWPVLTFSLNRCLLVLDTSSALCLSPKWHPQVSILGGSLARL